MNRREFLKGFIGSVAYVAIPGLIAGALTQTPPIQRINTSDVIKKKLLKVDELPTGQLDRYDRDVTVKSYVVHQRGIPA